MKHTTVIFKHESHRGHTERIRLDLEDLAVDASGSLGEGDRQRRLLGGGGEPGAQARIGRLGLTCRQWFLERARKVSLYDRQEYLTTLLRGAHQSQRSLVMWENHDELHEDPNR